MTEQQAIALAARARQVGWTEVGVYRSFADRWYIAGETPWSGWTRAYWPHEVG
jgi:hypothetical protein